MRRPELHPPGALHPEGLDRPGGQPGTEERDAGRQERIGPGADGRHEDGDGAENRANEKEQGLKGHARWIPTGLDLYRARRARRVRLALRAILERPANVLPAFEILAAFDLDMPFFRNARYAR